MAGGLKLQRRALLSHAECELLHDGSCRLLSEVGVQLASPDAIRRFGDAGATHEGGRVRIPRRMVDEALGQTAKRIVLGAKNPERTIVLDAEAPLVHFGTGGQALYVLDHVDGAFRRRQAVTQDLIDILRICEQLESVDFVTRPVEPDVAEDEIDVLKARTFMAHTTKHMNLANLFRLDKLPEIIDTVGDKSWLSFIACVLVSPLNLVSPTTEKLMRLVEEDIPVAISSCPQAGTTAPLSEVGELIQVNAEVLAGVVLANLVRPGARVLYRGIPITSNLHRDVSPRWCQPDSIRRIALISDMTYFYGIPCCGTAAVADEKEPSAQAVAEKTLGWVFEAASGAQFVNSALGMLEQVLTVSPEQYIVDDMVISHVKTLFGERPDYDVTAVALTAVRDALGMFGVELTPQAESGIRARVDFILSPQEAVTAETVDTQLAALGEAVMSGRSSSKFMKGARAGLRKGWLFQGDGIEGGLDLTEVHRRKGEILGQG